MDELLQFALVQIGAAIGAVGDDAALSDEFQVRLGGVEAGPKAKQAFRPRGRERTAPTQQVDELGAEECDPRPAQGRCHKLGAVGRQERGVQLGGGIEEPGQRQRPRGGNVVDPGAAPQDSGDQGRDAVVAQLPDGILQLLTFSFTTTNPYLLY